MKLVMKTQRLHRALCLVFVLAGLVASLQLQPVSATSNYGPDPDDVGPVLGAANPNILSYAVSNDGYTDITYNHLKIYSKGDRIAVFIANSDLCEGNREVAGAIDAYYSGANPITYGGQVTTYTLKNSTGTTVSVTGAKRSSAYCATGDGQTQWSSSGDSTGAGYAQTTVRMVLSHGASTVPGRNDTYQYDLDVAWDANGGCGAGSCGLNGYRIKVLNLDTGASTYGSGSNIWVSQDPSAGATQVGLNPGIKPQGNYFNSYWYFAPDCSLNGQSVTKRLTIYDDDNYNNAGVQPTTNPFDVRVQRKTRYGGSWATMSIPGTDISSPSVLDRKNQSSTGVWELGTSGNQHYIYIDFTVNADYIYRLYIGGQYYNNTIQFSLPYSNFWAEQYNQCQKSVSPQIDMPATANVGDTVTATFKINNASADYYNGYVNHYRYFYWDTGGSTGYETGNGDTLINPQSSAGNTAVNPNGHLQNNGTGYGPVIVGSTADISLGSWSGVAKTDASPVAGKNFTRICAALNLNADDSNTLIVGTVGWLIKCTDIGKYPSMSVTGGDVRTGGGFPSDNCSITAPASESASLGRYSGFSVIGHDYVGSNHTRAQFGVISPGIVNYFASNTTTPTTTQTLTFGNALPYQTAVLANGNQGVFYGAMNLSETRRTHCLTNVFDGRYNVVPTPPTQNVNAGLSGATAQTLTAGTSYVYDFNDAVGGRTLELNGLTLGVGQRTVVRVKNGGGATGNKVVINGNITYAPNVYASVYTLPQFVLLVDAPLGVGESIFVKNGVTQLDGIYASQAGSFVTCEEGQASTSVITMSTPCTNTLKVNGAIIAKGRLYVRRTAGHDTSASTGPAETFNLRPDTLLSDYGRNGSGGTTLETTYQTELSPRY